MTRLRTMAFINTAAAGAFGAIYFLPRTFYLDKIKSKLEAKKDEVGIPLSKYVQKLVDETMDDMKLKTEEKKLIKPFTHEGIELIHMGCSLNKTGAILGIPQHFCLDYRIPSNFVYEVDGMEVSLTEPDLMSFKNFMTLSKEAKKFGIACEIFESKHMSFYYAGILPITVFGLLNLIIFNLHRYKPIKNKKADIVLKLCITLWGVTLMLIGNIVLNIKKEEFGNLEAALLGEGYITGGLEYYEKALARNKTIKKLHNKAPFTEDGDLNDSIFGLKQLTLSKRIQYLKDLREAIKGNTKLPSIWDYVAIDGLFLKINTPSH